MATNTLVSKVARKEPTVRVPVPLRQSVALDLERYKEFYESVYEEPVDIKALMASMLETVLQKDKAFQQFKKNTPHRASAPAATQAPAIDLSLLPSDDQGDAA